MSRDVIKKLYLYPTLERRQAGVVYAALLFLVVHLIFAVYVVTRYCHPHGWIANPIHWIIRILQQVRTLLIDKFIRYAFFISLMLCSLKKFITSIINGNKRQHNTDAIFYNLIFCSHIVWKF